MITIYSYVHNPLAHCLEFFNLIEKRVIVMGKSYNDSQIKTFIL